jgi:hypothetical protein
MLRKNKPKLSLQRYSDNMNLLLPQVRPLSAFRIHPWASRLVEVARDTGWTSNNSEVNDTNAKKSYFEAITSVSSM